MPQEELEKAVKEAAEKLGVEEPEEGNDQQLNDDDDESSKEKEKEKKKDDDETVERGRHEKAEAHTNEQ